MARPRVAYILLWFPKPSETFILDEANTLYRLGLDLTVYTLYGSLRRTRLAGMAPALPPVVRLGTRALGVLAGDLARRAGRGGAGARRFLKEVVARRWRGLETAGEAWWAALAGVHLARRLRQDGISHIHAPWADGPATAAWVASHLSGIPFSFSARAHDLHPPDGALLEKMAAAAFVRTNTRANQRYLAGLAPWAAAKLVNVYNGISLELGAPIPARSGGTPRRLLAMGRLVAKKGFPVLLAACRRLTEKGVEVQLTLAGEGPERRRLQNLVARYGLENRVSLPGFIPHRQVPEVLDQSDLFVMPSVIAPSGDRDGIPNVVLEALAREVPVVATSVSGLPEVILPEETGWLIPPEDPEALAAAVEAALSDPAEARGRAQAGRELVAREFDSRKNYGVLKTWLEKS